MECPLVESKVFSLMVLKMELCEVKLFLERSNLSIENVALHFEPYDLSLQLLILQRKGITLLLQGSDLHCV